MRHRPVVIVFLRAPALGAVKRRLAAGIGMAAARRFYAETARSLLKRIGRDPHWEVQLAVTPDRAAGEGRYWPGHLHRFPQGQGDLGARMARAIGRFPHRPVVLIGSDIPDIEVAHIRHAFEALGRSDVVFGPATDGGYWLVGVRSAGLARGLFERVRWSGPHALADTVANAGCRRVARLAELNDVDDATDHALWRQGSPKA